jgi:urease accessory protein
MSDGADALTLTPAALIELMRLASPALPVGGFSYSEGLEAAVEAGLVNDEASTRHWLIDQLNLTLARCDLPAAAQAFDAWRSDDRPRVRHLNDWVTCTRETHELLLQTQQMGRSLIEWLRARTDRHDAAIEVAAALPPAPTWPIAFALAAARSGTPRRAAMVAFAAGWAENLVAAAIKAVPLGQTAGQRLLDALSPQITALLDAACARSDDERQAFAPMLAIQSALHETQYSRLFRS